MASNTPYLVREQPPKALIYLLLVAGLVAITYAIIAQKLLIAVAIVCLPIVILAVAYGFQNPYFVYLLYATYAFFFTTISRYTLKVKLSVGLDIILVYLSVSLLVVFYLKKTNFRLKDAVNIFTLSYIAWIIFILLQLANPHINEEGITHGIRIMILETFVLYIIASIVSNSPKVLRNGLILIGLFTIIAFLKLMYQRYVGFDSSERYWLYVQEAAKTHILSTGIRYFSYFTDAGNFGTVMGAIATVYTIIGFNTRNRKFAIFYLSIAAMGIIGMLFSGTRGALVVPFAGLALYCLICKSIRTFAITIITGLCIFAFLAFTDIGNGNSFIRRARTAFRPTADASFNVRIQNRKEMALYLKDYPFGIGIANSIPKLWLKQDLTYEEGTLPPDSYFVSIWIQTGIVGLVLNITIYLVTLLGCCYIVMFKVKDRYLRHELAAFTCTVFGILLSGYTGYAPGMPPTNFIIVAMIAFVMNGAYIDKQITQQKLTINKQ
ncbi:MULTISPECIES: O-antigen ligase family protein [Bacteroides]|uniref:O-antigen ligase domain-containing protein n=1 Tax=Bacteroides intestinalis TaxID=329854 RepID=A0A415MYZ8_9BACE|nr:MULTISPECIES: O-antigen ligase family protein [Bacteroides]RHL87797.1 O-antigen ligase domain-containing protein [Bacteroides intestinalis]